MRPISLALAQKALAFGMEKAGTDYSRPICAALCDAAGNLLAFYRMEGSPLRSIAISMNKAYTACRMGVNTNAFRARLQLESLELGDFCDAKFTSLPGGTVLKDTQGNILGGVGVSGLKAEEDQVITDAVAAFCLEQIG